MNWRRGFWRLWLVLSASYVVLLVWAEGLDAFTPLLRPLPIYEIEFAGGTRRSFDMSKPHAELLQDAALAWKADASALKALGKSTAADEIIANLGREPINLPGGRLARSAIPRKRPQPVSGPFVAKGHLQTHATQQEQLEAALAQRNARLANHIVPGKAHVRPNAPGREFVKPIDGRIQPSASTSPPRFNCTLSPVRRFDPVPAVGIDMNDSNPSVARHDQLGLIKASAAGLGGGFKWRRFGKHQRA